MKVAVLGSGNGGCAVAYDFAAEGYDVFMYDFEEFSANIEAISQKGGIEATGDLEGFQEIKYAGHDIKKVIERADIIFAVGPAYSTRPFGEVCAPYLESDQVVVVCPSSCGGSVVFKNAASLEIDDENNKVGVSVSKRNFKKAVDRIRIKRQLREAYRLNKGELINSGSKFAVMILFIGKKEISTKKLLDTIKKLLKEIK